MVLKHGGAPLVAESGLAKREKDDVYFLKEEMVTKSFAMMMFITITARD